MTGLVDLEWAWVGQGLVDLEWEGPGVGWEGPRRRGVGGAAGENSLSTSLRNCVATASKSSSLSESVPHPGGATRRSLFITASGVASSLSCCYV